MLSRLGNAGQPDGLWYSEMVTVVWAATSAAAASAEPRRGSSCSGHSAQSSCPAVAVTVKVVPAVPAVTLRAQAESQLSPAGPEPGQPEPGRRAGSY